MLRNFDLDLDMSKIGKDLKVQLALPNKKIIKNIKNITNASIDEVELNGLPIFTFEIPHKVEIVDFDTDNIEIVDNDDINNIKEEMLIKVTWYNGTKVNWFRVSDITKEENEENTFMVVESKSLPSELRATNVSINKESIDIIEYFETVLYQSPWKLGTVSDKLKNTYRSFDDDKKTRYEAVMSGIETFGAILDWDEENRVLNLKSIYDIREFRGVVLKRENYASSVSVQSSSEEIVTRLYGYGNEGLGIENSNPSGMPYIEDFSYFMSPFKRDDAKNVLSSSSYMSDELCHALLDLEDLKTEYNPKIQNLQNMINSAYTDLSRDMLALQEKQGQLITLQALLDTAKSTNDKDLIYQREMEIRDKELEISRLKENIENIKISIEEWDRQIFNFQQLISTSSFTTELIDELSLFVYEKEFNDDRYIDSQELYEASLEQMEKYQSPVKSFSIDLDSFINSLESQVFNGRLQIGEEVIIKSNKLNMEYRSIILGYNVDFESGHFELNISDNLDDISALDKLASIIYKAESSSTILNNNKYKWDGITSVVDEVSQWRDKEISTVENRITAGANESIVIDNRGIQAHNPDFPDERLIMQSGVIALSKDGGKTWNTSITPDGVIAETIIGKLFAGNNLIITNESGSFVIDSTGLNVNMDSIKIMSGNEGNPKDMIDLWNNLLLTYEEILDDGLITQHEKNQLQKQWRAIVDINSSMLEVFEKAWKDLEDSEPADSPKPKPKPKEYNDYILAYSELDKYLNVTLQSDGYAILDKDNREETTQVDSIAFAQKFKNYNEKKTIFESIIPLEFSNGKIEVLENGISLTYTKNSEIVTMLNLSEEGVRIDGKLLEINSRTEFNADLVMNAGVIKGADDGIIIDLNEGTIELNKPIKIGLGSNLVTKDDLEVLELEAYTVVLSNDNSFITTDKDGNNGDFSHAVSTVTVYKGATDDTSNWNITAVKSNGVVGALSGRTYTVTNMVGDSGKVIFTATNKSNSELSLSKDFNIIKTKAGLDGEDGKIKNINLVSDGYVISYKGEQPLPAKQTIKMQAFTDGLEGIAVWEIVPYKNNIAQSPITKSVVNNTIEINELDFANSVDMIKVKITCDGLIDTATIVKIRNGLDGNSGKDGIAGKDGVGVKTTKIEYSKSESGVTPPTIGWTTTIPLVPSGQFLWTKTTWVYTDNSSEIGYTVSKIGADGNTGQDGIAGKDGVGVKTTTIEYVGSTSGTTTPSTGWSTTIPTVTAGNYLWTKTTWTYTDDANEVGYSVARMGVNGKDGTDGIAGKDGVGLKNTVIEYAQSTSGITKPTSGWSINIPTVPSGNYLWTKTIWTYTDNTSEVGYSVSRIGKDGNTGKDGIAGKDGVGILNTSIQYVGSTSGTIKPTSGWSTTIPVVAEGSFLWTKTTWTYTDNSTEIGYSVAKMGAKGATGATGASGKDGIAGKDGVGISSTEIEYAVSTSGTTKPTSGWGPAIPTVAEGNYLWTKTTWSYTDDTNEAGYSVAKMGAKGVKGEDGSDAKLLYLSATAETMTFNADNSPNPTTQTISFTANMQNATGTATFTAIPYNGTTAMTAITLGGSGNTRTLTQSQFPATATRIQITATLGGLTDTVSVVKLKNGATGGTGATGATGSKGADGKNAIVGYLTNENITFPANSSGVVTSANLVMANGVFKVFDGLTEKTGSVVTYSVATQTGATGAITTAGAYSVSAISADNASITFRAIYNGATIDKVLTLSKSKEGVKGETGAKGATGSQGPRGATGTSVSSVTEYYLATSEPSGIKYTDARFTTAMQPLTATNKYLWNYEKINFSNGTSQPTIPVIIGVYGDKGQTGSTGATGRSIVSITEHYLATSASSGVSRSTSGWGTTMKPTTETNKYLWNYETINWSSGTTTTYVEPIIIGVHGAKGPQGATGASGKDGVAGKDGKGISSTTITYGLSTTDTVEPTKYTSSVPTLVKGQYLWTKTVWKYTDNTTETGYTKTYIAKDGNTGKDGIPGKAGVGISSTKIEYAGSTSGTTKPTSGWGPTVPTVAPGNYLWTKTTWTYTDNTTEPGYSVARMGVNGATGGKGATGATGASATSYWITASNNIIGKSQTGVINPTTITFKGFSKTGTANSVAYAGRFIIQTSTNGTAYTTRYTSSTNQNSYTYTIPADSLFVKCLFYMAGGTTVLLDEQTVPVVETAEGLELGQRNLIPYSTLGEYTGGKLKDIGSKVIVNKTKITIKEKLSDLVGFEAQGISAYRGKDLILTMKTDGFQPMTYYQFDELPQGNGKFIQEKDIWKFIISVPVDASKLIVGVGKYPHPATFTEYWIDEIQLRYGNKYLDWTPAPQDARTYKAWANSSEGTVDFTRVYPNENLIVLGNAQDNKGITWATGAEYTRPGAMLTDYIEVSALENITTSRATVQLALYNQNKEYLSSMPSSLLRFFIPSNGTSWTNKPSTLPTDTDPKYLRATYDGVQVSDTEAEVKLERGTTPTVYTTNTADSLSGSMPQYIGLGPLDSDNPSEYEWIINPEYTKALSDETTNEALEDINGSLEDKIGSEEFSELEKIADEFSQSYEAFISDGGKHEEDLKKLEKRMELLILELKEKVVKLDFVETYMVAGDEGLLIGSKDSQTKMLLKNNRLSFTDGGKEVAFFSGQSFTINSGAIVDDLQIGEHKFTSLSNGHTVIQWIKK